MCAPRIHRLGRIEWAVRKGFAKLLGLPDRRDEPTEQIETGPRMQADGKMKRCRTSSDRVVTVALRDVEDVAGLKNRLDEWLS